MPRLTAPIALILALSFAPVTAQTEQDTWQPMTGPQITAALTGATLQYASATQDFRASGRTQYVSGRPSWGYWQVRGDQYCSMWPPSDLWACYDMARRGDMLRFIGATGDTTDGTFIPRPTD